MPVPDNPYSCVCRPTEIALEYTWCLLLEAIWGIQLTPRTDALRSDIQKGICVMSESKSSENLIKTWAETQQKLLANWLDMVRRYSGTPGPELWTKTVEAWQASVKETLDAQAQWTREWTETLANA